MSGHSAIERTMDRIKTSWWWPSLKTNVTWHNLRCTGCQKTRKYDTKLAPFAPLLLPKAPNVGVHFNLFGLSHSGNKHILCMTVALTKIAIVVPIPYKEATIFTTNILHHWIYRFSAPEQIHNDGVKELVNTLSDELGGILGHQANQENAGSRSMQRSSQKFQPSN